MSDKPKIIGINRRSYPTQASVVGHKGFEFKGEIIDQSENPPPTLAVLVAGDIEDYACYVGHELPDWVARYGKKISFEEACSHFPGDQLERSKYRL